MDEALAAYWGLQLWQDYLIAKARWEAAHAEYVACPDVDPTRTREALVATAVVASDLLSQLRKTPEHLEAFGW